MRKILNTLVLVVSVLFLSVGFVAHYAEAEPPAAAGTGRDMPGYGWHCKTKEPTFDTFDPAIFAKYQHQKVIESYGWNAKSVDEIKSLLYKQLYDMVKHPEVWGPVRINVTDYMPYEGKFAMLYKENSAKYQGKCRLDENANISNYVAGAPFPEPKNGLEAIWNLRCKCYGDNVMSEVDVPKVDRHGNVKMGVDEHCELNFQGRLICDPKPAYKPNALGLRHTTVYASIYPYDVRELLGRKELLVVHNGKVRGARIKNKHINFPDTYYQKVNTYVLDVIPKDPKHVYSHWIIYLDPVLWFEMGTEAYDRNGKLYLFINNGHAESPRGAIFKYMMSMVDVQRLHSSTYAVTKASMLECDKPWRWFTLKGMRSRVLGR